MLLNFDNSEPFSTGSAPYRYSQVPGSGNACRIIVQVEVDGDPLEAILDTGGLYFVCNPELAESIGIDPANALDHLEIGLSRFKLTGVLHRLPIRLLTSGEAGDGDPYSLEVTAFFPDPNQIAEDQLPYSYLGMHCCMERFRFAIDPTPEQERFYFGACP